MEVQRELERARFRGDRWATSRSLAIRYGVSARTIWRYSTRLPTPQGLETLRGELQDWAKERDIRLTTDDLLTLLLVVSRHRDRQDKAA